MLSNNPKYLAILITLLWTDENITKKVVLEISFQNWKQILSILNAQCLTIKAVFYLYTLHTLTALNFTS